MSDFFNFLGGEIFENRFRCKIEGTQGGGWNLEVSGHMSHTPFLSLCRVCKVPSLRLSLSSAFHFHTENRLCHTTGTHPFRALAQVHQQPELQPKEEKTDTYIPLLRDTAGGVRKDVGQVRLGATAMRRRAAAGGAKKVQMRVMIGGFELGGECRWKRRVDGAACP
jgi:hypothetical protein